MNPLEQAKADLDTACQNFNNAASATTPPGVLQKAVRDLMCAVDNWADTKREVSA